MMQSEVVEEIIYGVESGILFGFPLDDTGEKMSVVEYFRQKYNIILEYAFLPARVAGSDAKPVYLPMEICKIVEGQRYSKKLNEKQVSALLKATCQRPDVREGSIKQMVRHNNYNNDKHVNEEFGIQVRAELTSVDARVLPPPRLKYHDTGKETRVDPRVSVWNMIDKNFSWDESMDDIKSKCALNDDGQICETTSMAALLLRGQAIVPMQLVARVPAALFYWPLIQLAGAATENIALGVSVGSKGRGNIPGAASDIRATLLLLLIGKCTADPAAFQEVGGEEFFRELLDDTDSRVAYYSSTFLLKRMMMEEPENYQRMLQNLVHRAQQIDGSSGTLQFTENGQNKLKVLSPNSSVILGQKKRGQILTRIC